MRLVLDTDVMVAAVQSPTGASRRLLLAGVDGQFEIAVSVPLMLEWEAVLKRPNVLHTARASEGDIDIILDQLAAICLPVELSFTWRPECKDPDDDMVLETAINGQADAIVTFNIRDLADAAARFGIMVERPATILRSLG